MYLLCKSVKKVSNFKVDANLAQSTKAIGARIEEWKDNEAKNTTVVSDLTPGDRG